MTEEILAGTVTPAEPTDTPAADAAGETKEQAKAPAAPPRLRLNELKPQTQIKGVVKNIAQFGAFVDIGVHQDGLVHISQLADQYVDDPNKIVRVGQHVWVHVTDVDVKRKRIALSMKNERNAAQKNSRQEKSYAEGDLNSALAALKNKFGK